MITDVLCKPATDPGRYANIAVEIENSLSEAISDLTTKICAVAMSLDRMEKDGTHRDLTLQQLQAAFTNHG